MKLHQAYKFRLKNVGQSNNDFWQQAGACRFVWNVFWRRQEYRRQRGHYVESFQTMCLALTQLKKHHTWLSKVDSTILQQALKDLSKAYKDGFDKSQPNKKCPKLKKKHKCNNSFRYTQRVQIEHGNRVYLPKLGWFTFKKTKHIEGTLKNTTVSFNNGHWYVSFQTERDVETPQHNSTSIVGVDLGVKRLATISNGYYIDGFNFKKLQARLKRLQRQLSKKVKFSNNWRKIKLKIGKIHRKVANIRHNLLHQLSHYLSKNHAIIVFEDLKIKNMSKSAKGTIDEPGKNVKAKSGLNKSILEQGWGKFVEFCQYKQAWKGGEVLLINPKGTSQTCFKCSHKSADNRKQQDKFHCQSCGHKANADDNASLNILAAGHAVLACGVDALVSAMKHEPTVAFERLSQANL